MQDLVQYYIDAMRAAGFTNSTHVYFASGIFGEQPPEGKRGGGGVWVGFCRVLPYGGRCPAGQRGSHAVQQDTIHSVCSCLS